MNIYLAGGEAHHNFLKNADYPHIFASFYTARMAGKLINDVEWSSIVIVDSGAHTFFSQAETIKSASIVKAKKSARASLENLDKYVAEYCSFINKYKDKVAHFVELDIDKIIGYKRVQNIRAKLIEAGGDQIIPCYHPTMGTWEENRDELLKFPYIGLEGSDKQTPYRLNQYLKIIKDCYTMGVKVHGFAMTKKWFMKRVPFYSVDSTSWRAISQFGRSAIRARGMEEKYKQYEQKVMRTPKEEKQLFAVLQKEVEAWRKVEKFYTHLWESRGIKWDKTSHLKTKT